jgi:hypothetical protein
VTDATYAPANLGDLTTPPTRYHRCGPGGSYTFYLNAQSVTTITAAGSSSTGTVDDFDTVTETGVSTRTDYIVDVEQLLPTPLGVKSVAIASSNEAVIANPVDGIAVGQATGAATIVARSSDGEVSARRVAVEITTGQTVTYATAPSEGSLHKHCSDQIENRIAGRDRDSMDLWSTRNNSQASYVWNENCWGADINNITCMSPYNTGTGNGGGGALITPRHVAFTHHLGYYPGVGKKIRYVTPSNVTEEFTITNVAIHPNNIGWDINYWDIVIAKLDRDVPSSIKFAKALPEDPSLYLPTLPQDHSLAPTQLRYSDGRAPWMRACHTTQNKRLATCYLRVLPTAVKPVGSPDIYTFALYAVGETASGAYPISRYPDNPLGDPVVTGDSGAPAFLIVNNELVLTSLWTSPIMGFHYYADATTINGMLDDLGGGYNLTEVDLSEFPTW